MAKLPKYICMKVSVENGLTVCLDPVEPEKVAADVRPVVYARWIELENPNYSPFDPTSQEYELLCSACGATHRGTDRNFCPNCGADMRPIGKQLNDASVGDDLFPELTAEEKAANRVEAKRMGREYK